MKSSRAIGGWRKAHVAFAWLLCLVLTVTLIRSRRATIGDEQLFPPHPAELLLSREVGRLELADMPLDKYFELLGQRTGVRIFVQWDTLGIWGIDRSKPISMNGSNLPLRLAILEIATEGTDSNARLHVFERDGMVVVAGGSQPTAAVVFRAYDISDLLFEALAVHSQWYPEFQNSAGGYSPDRRTLAQIQETWYKVARNELYDLLAGGVCWQNYAVQEEKGVDFWRGWMFVRDDEATHAKIAAFLRFVRHREVITRSAPTSSPVEESFYSDDLMHELLSRPMPAIHFEKAPLSEIAEKVGELANVSIHLNYPEPKLEGMSFEIVPITLDFGPSTLRATLNRVFAEIGRSPQAPARDGLSWRYDHGAIYVEWRGSGHYEPLTRTYDVSDLLLAEVIALAERAKSIPPNPFYDRSKESSPLQPASNKLVEVITDRLNGINSPHLLIWAGRLVATTDAENHKRIVEALEGLRRAAEPRPATSKPARAVPGNDAAKEGI